MEPHILTLKYIFKKSGKEFPDSCTSLEEFFQSGVYFPQFVALIYGLDSLPNTTKTPKNIMAKNINNNTAFEFLASKNSFFKNINSDFTNEKNRVNIIKSIIEKEYFKSTNKDCLNQCNQYLKQNNDAIANFSEFSNIIGFLKLFAAYMKCSPVDILIQYINSFDIPVVISKDSFSANQDILMFQALIILKQLQEGLPSPQQIPHTLSTSHQSQSEETSLPSKIEAKKQLSTNSNLIFEVPPDTSSDDQLPNSNEKELVLDNDIQKDTISTQTIDVAKKSLSTNSIVILDMPLQNIPKEPTNNTKQELSGSEDEDLNESHKKAIQDLNDSHKKAVEDLKKLVDELNHQKDELKQSLQLQCEEKKRLNNLVTEQEAKLKNTSITVTNLNKQVENLNSNLEKLGQSKKALEETKKQEIEKLNKTNTTLDENFKNLKKMSENQKATSSAEIMNLKKQIADLHKQKELTESELKKQITDLNKKKELNETELKKQITDLNKKKELNETELKKQISDLNKRKELNETELKKQINDLNKRKELTESELKKQITDLSKRKELNETELKKRIRDLEAKLPEKTTRQSNSNASNESARPISELLQPIYKENPPTQKSNSKIEQKSTQEKKDEQDQNSNTNPQRSYQSSPFFLSLPGLMNFL